ncbi:HAD hydrolase-like protein [Pseudolysinimonas sp.]|uniref:HAD hydrolase-like protein n=1 Tax=Pseudolysinimonas sp. TaxID=2680009 RepID=UPI00378373D1
MSDRPAVPRNYTAVLFDLDGTIVDSAPGITASLAKTLADLNAPIQSPAELLRWVGPPILDSFRDLGGFDAEESQRALDVYRGHYLSEGVFDATVYDGVPDVLRAISESRIPLSLATSKPETPATLVLKHYGLDRYFDELTGASDDEKRSKKADVIEEALRRLAANGADLSRTIMIGDRIHDVEGAAAHGIPTIYVTWGYGSPEESVGAVDVVDHPAQLFPLLGLTPPSPAD